MTDELAWPSAAKAFECPPGEPGVVQKVLNAAIHFECNPLARAWISEQVRFLRPFLEHQEWKSSRESCITAPRNLCGVTFYFCVLATYLVQCAKANVAIVTSTAYERDHILGKLSMIEKISGRRALYGTPRLVRMDRGMYLHRDNARPVVVHGAKTKADSTILVVHTKELEALRAGDPPRIWIIDTFQCRDSAAILSAVKERPVSDSDVFLYARIN